MHARLRQFGQRAPAVRAAAVGVGVDMLGALAEVDVLEAQFGIAHRSGADGGRPRIEESPFFVAIASRAFRTEVFEAGRPERRYLIFSEYPSKLVPPDRPLFDLRKTNNFGPQYQDLNLIGLAVSGDLLYGSLVLENKIVAFNWKTGEKAGEVAVQRPAGLQVRPDGKVVAAAGNDIIEIDRDLKQSRVLAKGVDAACLAERQAVGRVEHVSRPCRRRGDSRASRPCDSRWTRRRGWSRGSVP